MRGLAPALALVVAACSWAQPTHSWTLPVLTNDFSQRFVDLAADPDGNVFVLVSSAVNELENEASLVKMDPHGAIQWTKKVGQPGDVEVVARALATDRAGNVVVVGSKQAGALDRAFWHKYDGAGTLVHQGSVVEAGTRTDPVFYDVAFDHTNQFTAVGIVRVNGFARATIMRRGANNELRFQRYYAHASYPETYAENVVIDGAGNVFVAGDCRNLASRGLPFFWSYTPSGTLRYARTYTGAGEFDVQAAGLDRNGRFYAAMFYTPPGGLRGHAVIQLTPTGGLGFFRTWNPTEGVFYAVALGVQPQGGAVAAGFTMVSSTDNDQWRWSTYRANGHLISHRTRPSTGGNDAFYGAVPVDAAGNAYLCGDGTAPGATTNGGVIQQQLASGAQGWARPAFDDTFAYVRGGILDRFGNLIVTGFRWEVGDKTKIRATKYFSLRDLTSAGTSLPAGGSKVVTVRLAVAAPVGGARVLLSDNSARFTTPTQVIVPAGATSATFTVRATAGGAATGRVTAQYGGHSVGLDLSVTG